MLVFPVADVFAVSTLRAANTSSPGASTLRAGLICRAVPALALRSIRYCVPWQVPHPPRDLWRRQATRRCTPGPSRPRAPATRRGPSHRIVSPAGCAQGSRASSVCARHSRRRRSLSPARSLSAVSTYSANSSSPGATTLIVGLIYRAVPAFALRSIRCCVPWQVPHPPRDLWRRLATRQCTPGPFHPRTPAARRGPSYRTVSPAGCAQGSGASSVCARHSRRRRSFLRPTLSAVSTVGAANSSSPGASTLRVGLIYRAVPALALRSIRYCVPWQVPRPPRDLWRRRATRRCTPGPFRPRRPPLGAVRRTEPFLQPAAPRAAALPASVLVILVADGHFSGQHFLRYLRWEPRTVLAPVPLL